MVFIAYILFLYFTLLNINDVQQSQIENYTLWRDFTEGCRLAYIYFIYIAYFINLYVNDFQYSYIEYMPLK
jgi:hypothetical protein